MRLFSFDVLVPIMRRIRRRWKAGSGDEARFFRREVRDEAGDLRYITHSLQRNQGLDQPGKR